MAKTTVVCSSVFHDMSDFCLDIIATGLADIHFAAQ